MALELTLSQYSASAWADLAVQLTWRLAATGTAYVRTLAEATRMLTDEKARTV